MTMSTDLVKIVSRFYQANLGVADWSDALASVAEAVGAEVCALLVHDFRAGRGQMLQSAGADGTAMPAFAAAFAAGNVWLREGRHFQVVPSVVRGRDLIGAGALIDSEFYARALKPLKLLDHLFVILDRHGERMQALVVARAESKGVFEDEAVTLLSRLAPDFQRAVLGGKALRQSEQIRRIAFGSLDSMPIGVALLNVEGGVVVANSLAQDAISTGEGIYVANGGLAVEVGGRRLKMRDLVSQATASDRPEEQRAIPISVMRHSGKRPLTLFVIGIETRDELADGAVAILYVGDPDRTVSFDYARIGKLYGLSKAESRVAALLASGYRLEQAAEMLGVAYETVRKHLKQIFSKTGTYRQAELVRMLVTGPAGLSI